MVDDAPIMLRQRDFYWHEMTELKIAAFYMCRYRDQIEQWVAALGTIRAIASSVSIAAWAIWRQYAFLWGLVIAVSQVADALRDVFPFAKKHKAASEHAIELNEFFINAQLEWEQIYSGRYDSGQIMNKLHKLRKLRHDAERRSFPHGLPSRPSLSAKAQKDANKYFALAYKQ
jgi:hypothetical protein